jgi:excinuclease ABC subunit B
LIQTIGRSARNVNAKVILYADKITESMQKAIDETERRRNKQEAYNNEHGITPETIRKNITKGIEEQAKESRDIKVALGQDEELFITQEYINELEKEMLEAAERLEFERATILRDRIEEMRKHIGKSASAKMFDFGKKKRSRKRSARK